MSIYIEKARVGRVFIKTSSKRGEFAKMQRPYWSILVSLRSWHESVLLAAAEDIVITSS
jgi:hypothetical protein